jgi:hypothetical protein
MGVGAEQSTAFDPAMSGVGPRSPRARKIFNHMYGSPLYHFVKPAYDSNERGFRERADNYVFPDGVNLTLSAQLTALREEIERFDGTGFAARRAAISTKYAACGADDVGEVMRNRAWRDLVEAKFPAPAQRNQVKDALKIPR